MKTALVCGANKSPIQTGPFAVSRSNYGGFSNYCINRRDLEFIESVIDWCLAADAKAVVLSKEVINPLKLDRFSLRAMNFIRVNQFISVARSWIKLCFLRGSKVA